MCLIRAAAILTQHGRRVIKGHQSLLFSLYHKKITRLLEDMESKDGAVVRALASHQCGPGSIPRLGVICGLSLLVLYSAPTGFLRALRFPLSSKTNIWLDLRYLLISVYMQCPVSVLQR